MSNLAENSLKENSCSNSKENKEWNQNYFPFLNIFCFLKKFPLFIHNSNRVLTPKYIELQSLKEKIINTSKEINTIQ